MTIEQKVREIILNLYIVADDNLCKGWRQFDLGDETRVDKATQAILALMKPMSRERLVEILDNTIYRRFQMNGRMMDDNDVQKLADDILKEWEKEC